MTVATWSNFYFYFLKTAKVNPVYKYHFNCIV